MRPMGMLGFENADSAKLDALATLSGVPFAIVKRTEKVPLEFDDFVFRSWQESSTPLPPPHVAGNQLRMALFPGYIDIRPIDIRPVPTAI